MSTLTTVAGLSERPTNVARSSENSMISTFSPLISSIIAFILEPLSPTHAPIGSRFGFCVETAIFVL